MRRVFIIGAVVLIAAGGLLALLWQANSNQARPTYPLSDGTLLAYRGATFGIQHVEPAGNAPWVDKLPRALHRFFSRRPTNRLATRHPTTVLWFERIGSTATPADWHCSIVCSDGFEIPALTRVTGSRTRTNSMEGRLTPAPRRMQTLRVRVYEVAVSLRASHPIGEFTTENPAAVSEVRWTADALPSTRSEGDLEATLVSLVTLDRGTSLARHVTRAEFQIKDAGVITTNWRVETLEARDATGNVLVPASWGARGMMPFAFEFAPPLWPMEVYQLKVEFSPMPSASFSPGEVWELSNIPVPKPGTFTSVESRTNLSGWEVSFRGINNNATNAPWESLTAGGPSIDFSLPADLTGHRFRIVQVRDDQGRPVVERGRGMTRTNFSAELNLSNDVQRVSIIVALPRSRFLEFVAQPALTNAAEPEAKPE